MISLSDILNATHGQLFGDPAAELFTDFCFDSRRVKSGELFVALKTERGDGHQYIQSAIDGGALGILCHTPPLIDTSEITVIVTRDVEKGLLAWGKTVIARYKPKIVGVTGSLGKSTTKEAIACVLGTRYSVFKSPASYNGRLGLPLALSRLNADHQIAVLEYGTDSFGEIEELVQMAPPQVGVITAIAHRHTDRLGSLHNIAAQNAILLDHLPSDGLTILNYDDELIRQMTDRSTSPVVTISLDRAGQSYGADLTAYNVLLARDKTGFDLRVGADRSVGHWLPLLGSQAIYSALIALAVGRYFQIPIADGLRALTHLEPLPGRLRPLDGKNGSLIIDDTYSANPESALAALDYLKALSLGQGGRRIGILGDMDELGAHMLYGHVAIGRQAAHTLDMLITEGERGAVIARAALEDGMPRDKVRITYNYQDTADLLLKSIASNDVILVKGGAASRLERVVRAVLANPAEAHKLPRQETAYNAVWADRPSRPTWLEIDQTAIANNTRLLKRMVGPDTALMAVVKANAFGHGAVAVSTTALLNGADWLGVASVNEAEPFRQAGIDAPILILGYTPLWAAPQIVQHDLTLTLYDLELARGFDRAAHDMNAIIKAHVEIDTGMGRLGMLPEQAIGFFRAARLLKNIAIEGIFTHFSSAESDSDYTKWQIRRFQELVDALRAAGITFKYVHTANSAGTLNFPEARMGLVRTGIALYGLSPTGTPEGLPAGFRPALAWKTMIAQVKTLPPKSAVSYGNTYHTGGAERIAVIPVGYADGFRRSPHHWGYVLVSGQRAPLVGRVCMDQSMINVTHIPEAAIGSEVVLIGSQGGESLTADDVAARLGTINYELVSTILARVPRV